MLYAEPRFIEKLNELVHFRNNKKLKGSILLLEHNGSSIIGGRTYAVLRNNSVSIWEMSSHIFPFPFAQDINDKENGKSSDSEDSDNPKHSLKSVLIESPTFCLQNTFTAHRDKVTCASLSSDEFYLITGSIDRKVRLWCLRLKILIAEYSCHSKVVWDVHFNPSGYYFLSGSADGLMVLWSTEYENPTRIFMHGSDVYKVSFAKHPNYAISAGEDGRVKIWHLIEAQIKYVHLFLSSVWNSTTQ
jgi:WD40 repeat protein